VKDKTTAGITSYIDRVWIQNSSTGAGLTGLAYNTASLVMYYTRIGDTSATAVTLANCTLGTYTSGGFKEVDATNLPGLYEIHYPNAMLASGARKVHAMLKGAASMQPLAIEIELDAVDYLSAVNFGLTCLPSAAHSNTGGLITFGTSTGQFDPSLGQVKVLGTQQTAIAGKVWDELTSAHTTAGTYGLAAASDTAGTTTLLSRLSSTRAGYLDNLSAGAVALASGVSLADGAITAAKIASDAITAAKIATGAITSAKFAAGAIDAAAIATGAIDADALATDAVTEIWAVAVPGSFSSGSAAYVLGNIATGTPPTKEAVAAEVWATALPGSFSSGQAGYILPNISGGGGTDPWSVSLPGAYSAGTAGYIVGTNLNATVSSRSTYAGADTSGTTTLLSRLSSTRAGYLDNLTNLDAAVSTRSTYAGGDTAGTTTLLARLTSTRAGNLDYLDAAITSTASASGLSSVASNVSTILGQTGTTGVVVAAGSKSGYSLASSGLDSVVIETGVNARQALSVVAAAGGGVLAGAGTGTITIKGANVATTRITATTDSSGNRSSITLSLPS